MLNERVVFSLIGGHATSEQIPVSVAAQHRARQLHRAEQISEEGSFKLREANREGPDVGTAARKAVLRAWSVKGIAFADDVMFDLTNIAGVRISSAAKSTPQRWPRAKAAGGPRIRWPLDAFFSELNLAAKNKLRPLEMSDPVPYAKGGGDFSPIPFRVVASWPKPAFVEYGPVATGWRGVRHRSIRVTVSTDDDPRTGETQNLWGAPRSPDGVGVRRSGLALGNGRHDAHCARLYLEGQCQRRSPALDGSS